LSAAGEKPALPEGDRFDVNLFVDPACPFAWIAANWLLEVQKHLALQVRFRVMSLSVLNDGKSSEFFTRAWKPVRLLVATEQKHGAASVTDLYLAMGKRIHNAHDKNFDDVIVKAVSEVGLPGELVQAAYDTDYDEAVRASHREGVALVGPDVGTPVLQINGTAIFGPVMNAIPRGPRAVEVFHAVRTLAASTEFFEIKRSLSEAELDFD
jgi:hypothetical protein